MARFHVYHLKSTGSMVMDVQANSLDNLDSRIVIPLVSADEEDRLILRLNPRVEIDGKGYFLKTELLAAIRSNELGTSVADLTEHHDKIVAALDFAFQGF
jgi:toxin CcdB